MNIFILPLTLFCSDSDQDVADPADTGPVYGAFFNGGLAIHRSDFGRLPGVPGCCPSFRGAEGKSFSLGLLYEIPYDKKLTIIPTLEYSYFDGNFKEDEVTNVIIGGSSQPGIFEHKLGSALQGIFLSALADYNLFGGFYFSAGPSFGILTNSYYSQSEKITEPKDRGTFADGKRTRNQSSGSIGSLNALQLGLTAGLRAELPLNRKNSLFLAPELFYSYYLTNVVAGTDWNIHSIRAGLAVIYKTPPPPPPPPPPPLDPPCPGYPPAPVPPVLSADIGADIRAKDGVPSGALKIEDFVSLNMKPLLSYVFFDENSSQIPLRYKLLTIKEAEKFSLKDINDLDPLQCYYQVLNIIGKRLQENPGYNITLTGTNSDEGGEKANIGLSRARALAVKKYLINTWGIKDSRILVKARNLPVEFSNNDDPGGIEENRRVEITSGDFSIVEQVINVDTIRAFSQDTIDFKPVVRADAGIRHWRLMVSTKDKAMYMRSGVNAIPAEIKWDIARDRNARQVNNEIVYRLAVEDNMGQRTESKNKKIKIEHITLEQKRTKRLEDKEYEYYSLLLFDFGSSSLQEEHIKLLNYVRTRINNDSKVLIEGFTDKIGQDAVNRKISEKRAKAVARLLNIRDARIEGIGESRLLYDNNTPEGRFYCRTVKITIENPVKK